MSKGYKSLLGKSYGDKVVSQIRRAKSSFKHLVVPGMFFEDMGITYLGPVDGHNIPAMVRLLGEARKIMPYLRSAIRPRSRIQWYSGRPGCLWP